MKFSRVFFHGQDTLVMADRADQESIVMIIHVSRESLIILFGAISILMDLFDFAIKFP